MKVPILKDITLDIYRGEFTKLFVEPTEQHILTCLEDLLIGILFILISHYFLTNNIANINVPLEITFY